MSEVVVRPAAVPAPCLVRDSTRVVRLSVNLSPSVAETLRSLCTRKGVSITEGVRRAVAIWRFLEEERSCGHTLAIIERDGTTERIRELMLSD